MRQEGAERARAWRLAHTHGPRDAHVRGAARSGYRIHELNRRGEVRVQQNSRNHGPELTSTCDLSVGVLCRVVCARAAHTWSATDETRRCRVTSAEPTAKLKPEAAVRPESLPVPCLALGAALVFSTTVTCRCAANVTQPAWTADCAKSCTHDAVPTAVQYGTPYSP